MEYFWHHLRFLTVLLVLGQSLFAQNVGINNPAPLTRLHVSGGLLVDGNPIEEQISDNPDTFLIGTTGILDVYHGFVFDSGGPDGGYGNSETLNTTMDLSDRDCKNLNLYIKILSALPGDSLSIYSDPLDLKLSGMIDTVISTANRFFGLTWISDGSGTEDGFEVEWRAICPTIDTTISIEGEGGRLMWIPGKFALRSGLTLDNDWDSDSIGAYSTALGYNVRATSDRSFAAGDRAIASGMNGSVAIGYYTSATGDNGSFAVGSGTKATGFSGATALGINTLASGNSGATAFGIGSRATGNSGAIAMGDGARANGTGSIAAGKRVYADGNNTVGIGTDCRVIGSGAILIGSGIGFNQNLQNLLNSSFSVGFRSTVPTFVVTGGDNTPGSFGRVGIGILNPFNFNSEAGLSIGNGDLALKNGLGVFVMKTDSSGIAAGFDSDPDERLQLHAGGGVRATILPGGNMGIGSISPIEKLTVANGSVFIENVGNTDSNSGFLIGEGGSVPAFGMVYDGVGSGDNNKLHIREFVSGTPTSVITFTAGKKVGVNMEDPGAVNSLTRLEVGSGHIMVSNDFGLFARNSSNNGIGAGIDSESDDGLGIYTNGVKRAKFTTAGDLGIGTSNPIGKIEAVSNSVAAIRISSNAGSSTRLEFKRTGSDWRIHNTSGLLLFGQSSDDLATVSDVLRLGGGSVTPAADNAVTLGQPSRRWTEVHAVNGTIQTSDLRLKQDVEPVNGGLSIINSLNPVRYRWKSGDMDMSKQHLGFIAQELSEVLPEAVYDHSWVEIPDSDHREWQRSEYLGVNYSEITPVLVKAVQEQQEIIDHLLERIAQLEAIIEDKN